MGGRSGTVILFSPVEQLWREFSHPVEIVGAPPRPPRCRIHLLRSRPRIRRGPWSYFLRLAGGSRSGYAAYIDMGRWSVCSASPELFFRLQNEILESRPMKGTASRGRTTRDDEEAARRLRESEKDRAENLMIVDMIRNDIGRVADVGSVAVPRLCDVERFPFPVRIDHRGPEDRHDGDHRGIGDNAARPVLRHHRVPGAGRRSRPRPVQRGDPHGHDRPRHRHRRIRSGRRHPLGFRSHRGVPRVRDQDARPPPGPRRSSSCWRRSCGHRPMDATCGTGT